MSDERNEWERKYTELWEATACVSVHLRALSGGPAFEMDVRDFERISKFRDQNPPPYIGWLPMEPGGFRRGGAGRDGE